jgi:hypothetical protein
MPKLDLRVEAPLSNTLGTNVPGRYIYWDNYYHGLYTNRHFSMGDWVGRDRRIGHPGVEPLLADTEKLYPIQLSSVESR